MRDPETFEPRFVAAVGRYLESAPVEVDAVARAHATVVASRQTGMRRFLTVNTALRVVLVGALSGAALLGASLSGGQKVTAPSPSPSPCSTPAVAPSQPVPASSPVAGTSPVGAASPVEFLWSSSGAARDPMQFHIVSGYPQGGRVALDSTCRAWVADPGHSRFAIFTPDGAFVGYWGSPGKGDGQFNLLGARGDSYGDIAFAPDGSFYVLDVGNYRVQRFDKDRTFLGQWGKYGYGASSYIEPVGIEVDSKGVVYVLDMTRDVVERYTANGTVVDSFVPNVVGDGGDDLKVDAQGHVYLAVNGNNPSQVREYDPAGTLLATIPKSPATAVEQFDGMDVDATGRVFVARGPSAAGGKVEVYGAEGTRIAKFGGSGSADGQFGFGFSEGVALDGRGGIYITDGAGDRLEKFRLLPPLAP